MGNRGSNSNGGGGSQPPPLLQPAMDGNLDEVKRLVGTFLASYSLPNVVGDSKGGDAKLTEFVNRTDAAGNAAIHGAVFCGHLDIYKFLVDQCGGSLQKKNNLGCSPLWLAAGYNRIDILDHLLERVVPEALVEENATGDTPLLAAASRGHVEACRILLEASDDMAVAEEDLLKRTNRGGDTPLAVAVSAGHGGPLLELLLEKRYNGCAVLNQRNKQGLTPLLVACERNHAEIAKTLLHHGALPLGDANGASPLAVAAFCGCHDVVQLLLSMPLGIQLLNDASSEGGGGCTPLWLAARTGNAKMLSMLLEAGADPALANQEGLTPEQAAEKYKKQAVIDLFQEWNEAKNPVAEAAVK